MTRPGVVIRVAVLVAGLLLIAGCSWLPSPNESQTPSTPPSSSGPPATPPTADAITIQDPAEGDRVTVPLTATGTANTFEATLTVDVITEAGDVLCMRQVTATPDSGVPGVWESILGFAPQRDTDDVVTLRAYERSAEDGSVVNLVERRLTLSPEHPPILLTSPVCGDVVAAGGPLSVQGLATVFEAALTIELRDAAGTAVFSSNLMTSEGGVESPFGEIVTLPAGLDPGFYDLVAFSHSPKDGSVMNEFPVQLDVH